MRRSPSSSNEQIKQIRHKKKIKHLSRCSPSFPLTRHISTPSPPFFYSIFKWDTDEQVSSHTNDFNTKQDIKVEHEGCACKSSIFHVDVSSTVPLKRRDELRSKLLIPAREKHRFTRGPSISARDLRMEGKHDNGKFYEKASPCSLGVINTISD